MARTDGSTKSVLYKNRAGMDVTVISTGEELVSGETLDTNASFIARELEGSGFVVKRLLTIGDNPQHLAAELRNAARDSAAVLVNGGLGPTADDCTRKGIAAALHTDLVPDQRSAEHIRAMLRHYGRDVSPANLQQAMFPPGAVIFENPKGTARGFACAMDGVWVVAMPGVPDEMAHMFNESVLPFLREKLRPKHHYAVRTVNLFGLPESEVDERIGDLTRPTRNPYVSPTVRDGVIRLTIRARAAGKEPAQELLQRDIQTIKERFGDAVFGCGEETLAASLSKLLEKGGFTIAVAESCTGGLIGDMLTDVPGISRLFLADVVAYDNEVKVRELGVPAGYIQRFGAVSEEVAIAMARGVCKATGADVGLSTTGIAGPTGGTPKKPVGLVYVGLCVRGDASVRELRLRGERRRIKDRASKCALNFARLTLLDRQRNNLGPAGGSR